MTAREALEALRREGLAHSRPGKGTYVSQPRIERHLYYLTSFSQEMMQRGFTPSSRVLKAVTQPADEETARGLQVVPGVETAVLSRVRLANGSPIGIETAYLVQEMFPGLLARHDFAHDSLYRVLREEYGCVLAWARQIIEARMPQPHELTLLEMTDNTPVLGMVRTTYSQENRPVEYVRSAYRADRYQFSLLLRMSG